MLEATCLTSENRWDTFNVHIFNILSMQWKESIFYMKTGHGVGVCLKYSEIRALFKWEGNTKIHPFHNCLILFVIL